MPQGRPRIGVTRWEDLPGERIEDYWERVDEEGGEAIDLHGPPADVATLDGLILTGGFDIAPERYGDTPHANTRPGEPERDAFEIELLRNALAHDLPVLAICRGQQVLNVAMGGGLLQHIDSGGHRADYKTEGFPSRWHAVRLTRASQLRSLFGSDELEVNSRHHQAVLPETLALGLTPTATSPDGIVEAVESHAHRWLLGVQWHPERPEPDHPHFATDSRRLFRALVHAAQKVTEGA